jgi:hypothetical protein
VHRSDRLVDSSRETIEAELSDLYVEREGVSFGNEVTRISVFSGIT